MKNFDILVEKTLQTFTEGRIAHANKKFTLDFDAIEKHLNNISDEKPTKAFYQKMFNYLKNNPNNESIYTPESLKKNLELSLLDDTNSNVAKSMAKDFVNYLNARDVYKTVSASDENDNDYSEDVAQEILKLLQVQSSSKNELIDELKKKFPAFLEGGSSKYEKDFNLAISSLKKEGEIEEIDGKLQIASAEEKDFDPEADENESDDESILPSEEELSELEDIDDETSSSKFSKILADLD